MPGPDDDFDEMMNIVTPVDELAANADRLPVTKGRVPKISEADGVIAADNDFDEMMAADSAPVAQHAQQPAPEQQVSDEFSAPNPQKTVSLPVQKIEGEVFKPSWFDSLLGRDESATRRQLRDMREADLAANEGVSPTERMAQAVGAANPLVGGRLAVTAGQSARGLAPALKSLLPGAADAAAQTAITSGARAALGQESIGDAAIDSGLAGATAGAFGGGGKVLGKVAEGARPLANRIMTQTFMTAPQRAAYEAAKGRGALAKLGQDAEEAGLFKPRGILDRLLPINSRRVAENAAKVKETSGQAIGAFEDDLLKRGINPEVPVSDIAQTLRGEADNVRGALDLEAGADANRYSDLADLIERPEQVAVSGSKVNPPNIPPHMMRDPVPHGAQRELPLGPGGGVAKPNSRINPEFEQTALDFTPETGPAQAEMSGLDRAAKPDPWTPGDLRGEQQALNLPPREGQLSLGLDETGQRSFDFDTSAIPAAQPMPPGAAQGELFQGQFPRQGQGDLAALLPRQREFTPQRDFAGMERQPAQAPWQPGELQGQQLDFGEATRTPVGGQQAAPYTSAAEQQALELGPHRSGPQYQEVPLEGTANLARESLPLDQALQSKRYIANKVNWNKNPNARATDYGTEAARKDVWRGLKDNITDTLQAEADAGRIDPRSLEGYKKANRDFSTSATAYDPALKLAEREGQAGFSLTDLAAGAAVGGGVTGGLTSMASGATRGMMPSTAARTVKTIGGLTDYGQKAALAGQRAVSAIQRARAENPDAPPAEVEKIANEEEKGKIRQWFESLLR